MKVLELFAGTRRISKTFENRGHEVFSVDWDTSLPDMNLYCDIGQLTAEDIIREFGKPDVIWASFDCTTYSIRGIFRHRRKNQENGNLEPTSDYRAFCDHVNRHVVDLIDQLKPAFYFIENPRAGLRKMDFMQGLTRYTVTYCQYGDTRMKPTDIWTNHPNPEFKPPCKNGDPCHTRAPRGSTAGVQGQGRKLDRSEIPYLLCTHIVDICEKGKHERN